MADGWLDGGSADCAVASALVVRICAACVRSVPVTGASVSLMTRAGLRSTVHASDAVSARLEDLHFDLGEGPGIDAYRHRQPVLADDLIDGSSGDDGGRGRWPAFAPAACAAGARAVFAFPLQLGAAQVGVLVLYRDRPEALDAAQYSRALRLAEAEFFAVLDLLAGAMSTADGEVDGQWHGSDPTFQRAQVYQAAGMLTVQLGVSIEEAMVRLRGYAYAGNRQVLDVAGDIVGRVLRLPEDNHS